MTDLATKTTEQHRASEERVTACVDAVMQFRLKRRSRFERFMRRWFPWSQYVRDKELYDSMSAIAARQTARAFLDMPVPPKRPS